MDGVDFQLVLSDLRAQLDALDMRLAVLLKERADVIYKVIERKLASGLGPIDLKREEEMLSRFATKAESIGLNPLIATKILRAIIDAFTALEAEALESRS